MPIVSNVTKFHEGYTIHNRPGYLGNEVSVLFWHFNRSENEWKTIAY